MTADAERFEPAPLILVVDDEATQRLLTRDCLESEGFRVVEAEDGDTALNSIRTQRPDAVLLDVMMPGRDGFSVCSEIRDTQSINDMPIILVTGKEDEASIQRAFAIQANDFITKPVLWPLLPHRLRFVLRDHRLRKELHVALTAAEAASKAKTEFLTNVSHELRTPLNAIIGYSEMIKNEEFAHLDGDEIRDFARQIHQSGGHLLSIINDILDIANIESATISLTDGRVALQDASAEAIGLLETHAADREITVVNRIGADAPEILGDRHRITQVLANLLSNAVKFSKPGDSVEISFEFVDHGGLAVHIADTGPGVPTEELARIMEPFQQLDGSLTRRHGGTGLGIPIARAIARLHGGDLQYESRLGEGTTASLLLPADRILAPNAQPQTAHQPGAA